MENPKILDSHSHLQFKAFGNDSDEVIKRTLAENIWMVNVGTNYETSKNAVEMAEKYEQGVFAAVGLHPMYAAAEFVKLKTDPNEGEFLIKEQSFSKEDYKKLALGESRRVIAIGEIGLDYYYKPKGSLKLSQFKEKQKKIFLEQLDLAKELNLPVILHCRFAHADMIELLESYIVPARQGRGVGGNHKALYGVVHCFTGTIEDMKKYIDLGFYIGVNGIIFKLDLDKVIQEIPLNKILLETDCPYLTPLPAITLAKVKPQGYLRNEPFFISHVAKKVAELKGVSFQEVCQETSKNARELFRI